MEMLNGPFDFVKNLMVWFLTPLATSADRMIR